jgi:hypothetical protein
MYTTKKNTEAVVGVSKKVSIEVNREKTKYMLMPQYHNAGNNC